MRYITHYNNWHPCQIYKSRKIPLPDSFILAPIESLAVNKLSKTITEKKSFKKSIKTHQKAFFPELRVLDFM